MSKITSLSFATPNFSKIVKTNEKYTSFYNSALIYAHYELSTDQLKKETIKYLKNIDPRHPLLHLANKLDDKKFAVIGKYTYIVNHGGELPDQVNDTLMFHLEKILTAIPYDTHLAPEKVIDVKSVISIQDRLKEKACSVAGEIEGWLDDMYIDRKTAPKAVEDFVTLFKSHEIKSPHAKIISDSFCKNSIELTLVMSGTDKEASDAYSHYTKSELKKLDQFYKNLQRACNMLMEVAKVERIPRKKKQLSVDKIVAKVKYKKEDNTLGIVSINPTQIIGAKELWVYDTKLRKITRYVADETLGPLNIKGTAILGFDNSKSITKTLRKPNDQLGEFKKCTKVQLRKFIDNITTLGIKPNGSLNENQVLLKVQ